MKKGSGESTMPRSNEVSAFLEEGCELDGNLSFTGIVRINGKFTGKITSEDSIIIGSPAKIEADLYVGSANIGGRLKGAVHAKERIEIQSTGFVEGVLCAPVIIVHEGAQIVGEVKILRDPKSHENLVAASRNAKVS